MKIPIINARIYRAVVLVNVIYYRGVVVGGADLSNFTAGLNFFLKSSCVW